MEKIDNKENVTRIIMKPTACVKCHIGQDWYQCNFEVIFLPDKYYPDYIKVQNYIMDEIDGKELNIEQAAKMLYDHLNKYEPFDLVVTNHITGCKSHFDVDVTVE